ncbi:MAG: DUF1648 domain-containing protein, partial [Anaerolineae bacterium]
AGPTLFYSTLPLRQQIFISTPGLVYAISPTNRQEFLESLRTRLEMGPTQAIEQSSARLSLIDWPIWQDSLGLSLLGVSTLALATLLGMLSYRFSQLPMLIPLHFGMSGSPDRLGPRVEIFLVPLIGLLTLLVNGLLGSFVYRRSRLASYLLWASSILIQVLVWTATFGILTRI